MDNPFVSTSIMSTGHVIVYISSGFDINKIIQEDLTKNPVGDIKSPMGISNMVISHGVVKLFPHNEIIGVTHITVSNSRISFDAFAETGTPFSKEISSFENDRNYEGLLKKLVSLVDPFIVIQAFYQAGMRAGVNLIQSKMKMLFESSPEDIIKLFVPQDTEKEKQNG